MMSKFLAMWLENNPVKPRERKFKRRLRRFYEEHYREGELWPASVSPPFGQMCTGGQLCERAAVVSVAIMRHLSYRKLAINHYVRCAECFAIWVRNRVRRSFWVPQVVREWWEKNERNLGPYPEAPKPANKPVRERPGQISGTAAALQAFFASEKNRGAA